MNASQSLPSLSGTQTLRFSPSPNRPPHRPIGGYVSPLTRGPHPAEAFLPSLDSTRSSRSTTSSSSSGIERDLSPTGFNKPKSINTPVRTVRRMFHYASPVDRKAFYEAFLDRPTEVPRREL